jgi:glycine cleavage system H protein
MSIPQHLRYTLSHEWLLDNGDGTVTVGITAFAAEQLGDVVFWECSALGDSLGKGDPLGTVESVKAVSDVYAPVSGAVVESNAALEDAPEQVNSDPYGAGWMVRLQLADPAELDALMDAHAYEAHTQAH